ncbi:MAG TPA: hypothetical protein VNV25_02270 [Gemmatimonadaceae bacterium]|jgi:hypothetical protein|nr:hypothetical protein [Gemmatimonadaceae bacterium]
MSDLLDLRRYHELADHEKAAAMQAFGVLARLAVSYVRPILFGRTAEGAPAHTASGFLVVVEEPFLVTARHNMEAYDACAAVDPTCPFQFGQLSFSPIGRRRDVDKDVDIAVISLSGLDLGLTTAMPYIPKPSDWPPPPLDASRDSVIVSGLPRPFRSFRAADVALGAYALFARVKEAREGYVVCLVDNASAVVGAGDDGLLHDPGMELNAMSGGPVLRLGSGPTYPIVGVMSQCASDVVEALRIAHLGAVWPGVWSPRLQV